MSRIVLSCLLFLSALGLTMPAHAAECTEITTVAQTLSAPGHYCLGADLATGQTGITINTSHVDLDCRGYSLRSTNTNSAQNTYGVYINNQSDVHVHHCHISGNTISGTHSSDLHSNVAIKLAQGSGNRITGNRVSGSDNINTVGILGSSGDLCFDNYIRANNPTGGCDNSLGNY